jgi:uncharacterized protein YcfJ
MRHKILAPALVLASTLAVAAAPIAASAQPRDYDRDHHRHKVWVCPENPKHSATGGTIVGALGGALVGSAIAGHGSKTTGALVGAGVGGLAGHQLAKEHAKHKCHWEWR